MEESFAPMCLAGQVSRRFEISARAAFVGMNSISEGATLATSVV